MPWNSLLSFPLPPSIMLTILNSRQELRENDYPPLEENISTKTNYLKHLLESLNNLLEFHLADR